VTKRPFSMVDCQGHREFLLGLDPRDRKNMAALHSALITFETRHGAVEASAGQIAQTLGVSQRTAERWLSRARELGLIVAVGQSRLEGFAPGPMIYMVATHPREFNAASESDPAGSAPPDARAPVLTSAEGPTHVTHRSDTGDGPAPSPVSDTAHTQTYTDEMIGSQFLRSSNSTFNVVLDALIAKQRAHD